MSALDTIGLVVGGVGLALGIVQFALDQIPSSPDPKGPIVSIRTGKALKPPESTGGGIAGVYTYDVLNKYLGVGGEGGHVSSGGQTSITVEQTDPSQEVGYIDLIAGGDELCVAWITVKNFKGPSRAWTGDYGKVCGGSWYHSCVYAGKSHNKNYYPKCTYLDYNLDHKIPWASIKIDMAAYSPHPSKKNAKDHKWMCSASLASKSKQALAAKPHPKRSKKGKGGGRGGNSDDLEERGNSTALPLHARPRHPKYAQHVVVSTLPELADGARELCESETSYGPDFIDLNGNYCDMENKQLMPLCTAKDEDGCIHMDNDGQTVTLHQKNNGQFTHFRQFSKGSSECA